MEPSRHRISLLTTAAAIAAAAVAVSPSCGASTSRRAVQPKAKAPANAKWIKPVEVEGHWVWSHVVEDNDVRRIEVERWKLAMLGADVKGQYEREVTFLSADGNPFECNQSLSYKLKTRYELAGKAHAKHIVLRETKYEVDKSPCDGGYRKLGRYEGFLTEGKLMLIWKGGYQTLARSAKPKETNTAPASVSGTWRWQNRGQSSAEGEVRVEREDWELTETEAGSVTGTYLRAVTVYDANGQTFDCNGKSQYRYQDRYTVSGIRDGTSVVVSEVSVDSDDHPCLPQRERHLDIARGQLSGSYLELTWRGGHKQVLRR